MGNLKVGNQQIPEPPQEPSNENKTIIKSPRGQDTNKTGSRNKTSGKISENKIFTEIFSMVGAKYKGKKTMEDIKALHMNIQAFRDGKINENFMRQQIFKFTGLGFSKSATLVQNKTKLDALSNLLNQSAGITKKAKKPPRPLPPTPSKSSRVAKDTNYEERKREGEALIRRLEAEANAKEPAKEEKELGPGERKELISNLQKVISNIDQGIDRLGKETNPAEESYRQSALSQYKWERLTSSWELQLAKAGDETKVLEDRKKELQGGIIQMKIIGNPKSAFPDRSKRIAASYLRDFNSCMKRLETQEEMVAKDENATDLEKTKGNVNQSNQWEESLIEEIDTIKKGSKGTISDENQPNIKPSSDKEYKAFLDDIDDIFNT